MKVLGQEDTQKFEDVGAALQAILKLRRPPNSRVTVYGPLGTVIFETVV